MTKYKLIETVTVLRVLRNINFLVATLVISLIKLTSFPSAICQQGIKFHSKANSHHTPTGVRCGDKW
jgi:hypothetical protein